MADITMCNGKGCTMKETCYRFKANACEYYQAYFTESPHNNKVDEDNNTICEHYWEVDKLRGQKNRGINFTPNNKINCYCGHTTMCDCEPLNRIEKAREK